MTVSDNRNSGENRADQAERAMCPCCKGRGLVFKTYDHRTDVFCCDQCDAGGLLWSRALELLADMDTPSPVEPLTGIGDSVVIGQIPKRYALPSSIWTTKTKQD